MWPLRKTLLVDQRSILYLVDFAGLEELGGAGGGFAIAGAENSFGQVLRVAVGPYVD